MTEKEAKLIAERDELQQVFDLRWKADQRAIARWQAAHPGKENIWPDHADMVVWLLERLDHALGFLDEDERAAIGCL